MSSKPRLTETISDSPGSHPFVAFVVTHWSSDCVLYVFEQSLDFTYIEPWGSTAWITSYRDVGEARLSQRINEWVQEPKRWKAAGQSNIVQKANEAGKGRRGSRRATYERRTAAEEDAEVICLRGYIWDCLWTLLNILIRSTTGATHSSIPRFGNLLNIVN